MRITNINMKKIAQFIMEKDFFLVTSHQRPDGDALGSGMALVYMLQTMGKYAFFIIDDTIPAQYRFLPFFNEIRDMEEMKNGTFQHIIVLDASNLKRIGRVHRLFSPDYHVINMDHHPDNERFGTINWVEEDVAATGELIFKLAKYLKVNFSEELATLLATAIITDTGSFKFSNTTPFTHRTMAELMEEGAHTSSIIEHVYGHFSYNQLQLLSMALAAMESNEEGSLAWCIVDQEMIEKSGVNPDDSGELVSYPRSLEGVEAGILFIEVEPGVVRVNLRSNGSLQVNRVANQFGGGGHTKAAGCVVEKDIETTKQEILGALERELSFRDDGDNQSV